MQLIVIFMCGFRYKTITTKTYKTETQFMFTAHSGSGFISGTSSKETQNNHKQIQKRRKTKRQEAADRR